MRARAIVESPRSSPWPSPFSASSPKFVGELKSARRREKVSVVVVVVMVVDAPLDVPWTWPRS